jgi:hypothetical protein
MRQSLLWAAFAAVVTIAGCGEASDGPQQRTSVSRGGHWSELYPRFFGVEAALPAADDTVDRLPREMAEAGDRVRLARGLEAEYVSRDLASPGDMIALYPNPRSPTHLIVCVEQARNGVTPGGNGGMNPSLQRVELSTGKVETILHGMDHCDGVRMTPWGTVLATEETADGRAYELIGPMSTAGHWIADREQGDIRAGIDSLDKSDQVVQRAHLPTMAWEGLAVLPSGVIYAGDELRPGDAGFDRDGGAIYKFLPAAPRENNALVSKLEESPLAAGSSYALTVSCYEPADDNFPQSGQGCEVGDAAWVQIDPARARDDASDRKATGYMRPEDLHLDPAYQEDGVKFCWSNTGHAAAGNYGEVMCAIDYTPVPLVPTIKTDRRSGLGYLADRSNYATARVNRFVEGDPRFNSFDNLAFQPDTGNLVILEDHPFGEIIACLADGEDRDIKSDGCIAIGAVLDPKAEPTGLIFDASGENAYLVLQHGEQATELLDFDSNPTDGTTDDLIRISGFEVDR